MHDQKILIKMRPNAYKTRDHHKHLQNCLYVFSCFLQLSYHQIRDITKDKS
jgi:hypothetical protein